MDKKGVVYSQRYFQNDLEDFGRFDSEGAVESGRSLASLELAEWEGTGAEFYQKFAGDPNRGGILHIRETEELYTGVITAMDDNGKKRQFSDTKKGNMTDEFLNGMKMVTYGMKLNLVMVNSFK